MLLRFHTSIRRFSNVMPKAVSSLIEEARNRVVYKEKVPSDIDVSQSVEPIHIAKIAADAGLKVDEVDLYGSHKAKIHLKVRERLKHVPNGME
jgi:Formate--tetrahydrofolate ligase